MADTQDLSAPALVPRVADDRDSTTPAASKLNLSNIRRSLPPHIFEKDLTRSLYYFIVDAVVLLACFRAYSPDMSWPAYILYFNITGLFMWCMFVIGHDAGHGTFSDDKRVNACVGHLAHGPLLVPFWPWARSHALHHAYHNHKAKDRSHVWFTKEEEGWAALFKDYPALIPVSYGIGYLLMGYNDGSHYWPFSKLHPTTRDKLDCAFSSGVCVAFALLFRFIWGSNVWAAYFGPWLCYNTWLYAVTYLQHHGETTQVFGDGAWSFTRGAMETVDRVYDTVADGTLDAVMHNITDGHVVHHLFSTSIPHYNLIEATKIVKGQLGSSYKMVRAFPLKELLLDHWYSTRPHLVFTGTPDKEVWSVLPQAKKAE
ncbi:hypothetical protein HK101_008973 [Irineochytrium annulatum]|nr:hypothetical protein HK101_008973 [Irineochytrium annulatum]